MRDPMNWALPLGRWFGVAVRVHWLFIAMTLAVLGRVAWQTNSPQGVWVDTLAMVTILFFSVLLHEFGHCFGARYVDGEATEILMWPLGGLAFTDIPHTPRAHFITVAAGPAVTLALVVVFGVALACCSIVPSFNPTQSVFNPTLYNWQRGHDVYSRYSTGFFEAALSQQAAAGVGPGKEAVEGLAAQMRAALATKTMTTTQYWLWFGFQLNWLGFLFNLLPAFPLDGGRLTQCVLWWRSGDYRQATTTAVSVGQTAAVLLACVAFWFDAIMLMALACFMYVMCQMQWFAMQQSPEETQFGYDFSAGYTSLERGETQTTQKRRQPNFIQRWMQRRAARKAAREQEQRDYEVRRVDELLEKLHRDGKLSDDEQRELTRVSARYRKRG